MPEQVGLPVDYPVLPTETQDPGTQVAQVRLAPSVPGGGSPDGDQMTPVEGWITFPIHNSDHLANTEVLDRDGTLKGTTLPFPCC